MFRFQFQVPHGLLLLVFALGCAGSPTLNQIEEQYESGEIPVSSGSVSDSNGDGVVDTYTKDDGSKVPFIDTNGDGKPDNVDVNGDGKPDGVDIDGDGDIDAIDTDGDGVADTCLENNKALICHVTGNEKHTVCISKSSVQEHFDHHGDYAGVCK
jgi:hypothetical protein